VLVVLVAASPGPAAGGQAVPVLLGPAAGGQWPGGGGGAGPAAGGLAVVLLGPAGGLAVVLLGPAGGRAVLVHRRVQARMSRQYQRTSAQPLPPSGTSCAVGRAMPHSQQRSTWS
jgi:hypothetical protein